MKINNIDDLINLKNKMQDKIDNRLKVNNAIKKHDVLICMGTGCVSSGSEKIKDVFIKMLEHRGISEKACIYSTGCFGFCKLGPIVVIYPEKTFYCQVGIKDVKDIVDEHLAEGKKVERLLYKSPGTKQVKEAIDSIPFFKKQQRIALRNCGVIDPESIEEYIGINGYFPLYKALTELNPQKVIEMIADSGLRGRGGGGFSTGLKWKYASQADSDEKFVICNADEGDPGAFMDRSILEGDPHSIIEAMSIAGYAIGADRGFIYVRAEYPIAVDRLEKAIEQARGYGLLGSDILGTGFNFSISLRLGAGAFVCGEETALIRSTMGKRGEPRPRPPFPAVSGLMDRPTLVNNVETLANIAIIIQNGPGWYSSTGTERSKGTKVFALAGQINNTGLIEVPMGTKLKAIIYDIGGGIPGGKKLKAVQTGGPSGGCIPDYYLDTPIDYESLSSIGSMMGSGGMIVLDETSCMVDVSKFYIEFSQDESCGKCTPCRVGTLRMLEILRRITGGEGQEEDLDELMELGEDIKESSLCGLGQTAPNPVLSTVRYFRDEYIAHIREKRCPAGVCSMKDGVTVETV